jgi:hypothetical protein
MMRPCLLHVDDLGARRHGLCDEVVKPISVVDLSACLSFEFVSCHGTVRSSDPESGAVISTEKTESPSDTDVDQVGGSGGAGARRSHGSTSGGSSERAIRIRTDQLDSSWTPEAGANECPITLPYPAVGGADRLIQPNPATTGYRHLPA